MDKHLLHFFGYIHHVKISQEIYEISENAMGEYFHGEQNSYVRALTNSRTNHHKYITKYIFISIDFSKKRYVASSNLKKKFI